MILKDLTDKGLIHPPAEILYNTVMLTIAGSNAYGVADTSVKDKVPDFDIYGVFIPKKEMLFPQQFGQVIGFGDWHDPSEKIKKNDPWQKHQVFDAEANGGRGKEWDFNIFGIVRYFELLRGNNPNLIDTLFTPEECVIHITQVGRLIRDHRRRFLGKVSWKKFRGYALSELKKAENKMNQDEMVDVLSFEDTYEIPHAITYAEALAEQDMRLVHGVGDHNFKHISNDDWKHYCTIFKKGVEKNTRFEANKKFQMDRKFLYHIVRLYDEGDQIISSNGEADIDLRRSKEIMKAVRRGEWSTQQIRDFVAEKDIAMEAAYSRCTLPEYPDTDELRKLLYKCLEVHCGDLSSCYQEPDWSVMTLRKISEILDNNRDKLF